MDALESLHFGAIGLFNPQRDGLGRLVAQKIGDDSAIGRISAAIEKGQLAPMLRRLFQSIGSDHPQRTHILLAIAAFKHALKNFRQTPFHLARRQKIHRRFDNLIAVLMQRGQVIQNPKRTAMRRHNQIRPLDLQVIYRADGQIQLKTLPRITAVKRDIQAEFRPQIEQADPIRILADSAAEMILANPIGDRLPALPIIPCAEDIRRVIIILVARRRHISCRLVVRRTFDHVEHRPFAQARRCNLIPSAAAVFADMQQTVIRTSPNHPWLMRRFSQRIHRRIMLGADGIAVDGPARRF